LNNTTGIDSLADDQTIWIAGGGQIYSQLLPRCSELYLTRVHRECQGDAFFPSFEDDFSFSKNLLENSDFTVELWLRN
jgi:dihydrofolate reductase